jgi:hypothetical protein
VNVEIVLRLDGNPLSMQLGVIRHMVALSERPVRGPETTQDEERGWPGAAEPGREGGAISGRRIDCCGGWPCRVAAMS